LNSKWFQPQIPLPPQHQTTTTTTAAKTTTTMIATGTPESVTVPSSASAGVASSQSNRIRSAAPTQTSVPYYSLCITTFFVWLVKHQWTELCFKTVISKEQNLGFSCFFEASFTRKNERIVDYVSADIFF
jgi:hypothetical protein